MVKVSDIQKVRGRILVRLDDGSEYMILKSMLRDRPLEVNQPLDPAEFSHWVASRQYQSALEKSIALLAVRARSGGEIRQSLRRIGYAPETVSRVMEKLEQEHLLDDQDFADAWTRSRASRRYGPRRIALELRQKGISEEDAAAALEAIPEEDLRENALSMARKALLRAKPGEDPRRTRQRIIESLIRRGYSFEDARIACDEVLGDQSLFL